MSSSLVICKLFFSYCRNLNLFIYCPFFLTNKVRIIFFQVVNYDVTETGYDIQIKSWKKFFVENWRGS
ncbi:unnamed protein product [Angiostrongylus costaricensis]|uniref:Uncharacterized protein n=1 Tax=Angiostrongylus costaricensis TaxID=334426 RepID=A0A0R3PN61_ANGCS|nr:unnamed protein product [Angiostrongylus costaricensis]